MGRFSWISKKNWYLRCFSALIIKLGNKSLVPHKVLRAADPGRSSVSQQRICPLVAVKCKCSHATCTSVDPKLQLSQNLTENWERTMPCSALLHLCLQDTMEGKEVLLVWRAADLLPPCESCIWGWSWLHRHVCPTRQCSRTSRTRLAVWS